jgi:hypothetical protein
MMSFDCTLPYLFIPTTVNVMSIDFHHVSSPSPSAQYSMLMTREKDLHSIFDCHFMRQTLCTEHRTHLSEMIYFASLRILVWRRCCFIGRNNWCRIDDVMP